MDIREIFAEHFDLVKRLPDWEDWTIKEIESVFKNIMEKKVDGKKLG